MNIIEIYGAPNNKTMIVNLFAYIWVIVDIHMGIDIRHAGKNWLMFIGKDRIDMHHRTHI